MIAIARLLAHRLDTVLRTCACLGTPPTSLPPLFWRAGPHGLRVHAHFPDLAVAYATPGARPPARLALPGAALGDLAGMGTERVSLERLRAGGTRARWLENGQARERRYATQDLPVPDRCPASPRRLHLVPPALWRAAAAAAATAAAPDGPWPLTHVQWRGRTGTLAASDGRQLLVAGGWTFPWREDLLVAARPLGACLEILAGAGPLCLGRTTRHLVLRARPWTFFLPLARPAPFPALTALLHDRAAAATVVHLSGAQAAALGRALLRLPGGPDGPVTLELGACVRVQADAAAEAGRVLTGVVAAAQSTGPPVCLRTSRTFLRRALALGFTTFAVVAPHLPVVCRAGRRLYAWAPLVRAAAAPAAGVAAEDAGAVPPAPGRDPG